MGLSKSQAAFRKKTRSEGGSPCLRRRPTAERAAAGAKLRPKSREVKRRHEARTVLQRASRRNSLAGAQSAVAWGAMRMRYPLRSGDVPAECIATPNLSQELWAGVGPA